MKNTTKNLVITSAILAAIAATVGVAPFQTVYASYGDQDGDDGEVRYIDKQDNQDGDDGEVRYIDKQDNDQKCLFSQCAQVNQQNDEGDNEVDEIEFENEFDEYD